MIKYNIKLNQGNEVLNSEKSTPASGNQGNTPNPGSGDDGMS